VSAAQAQSRLYVSRTQRACPVNADHKPGDRHTRVENNTVLSQLLMFALFPLSEIVRTMNFDDELIEAPNRS